MVLSPIIQRWWPIIYIRKSKIQIINQGYTMRKLIYSALLLMMLTGITSAQTYSLNGYVGVGYARFLTDMDLDGLNQNGYNTMIRLMWKPEHLLSVGLESGYHYLYNYESHIDDPDFGSTNVKSTLTGVPLFFVAAMEIIPSVELLGGIGPTFLNTYFNSYGVESQSSQITTSYFVAGRYEYPINESLALGGELNYYRINKIEDSTLSVLFVLSYRLMSW